LLKVKGLVGNLKRNWSAEERVRGAWRSPGLGREAREGEKPNKEKRP